MMLVIIFEQIFLLYFDAGGRSLLIGDHLENCWLATSNSCIIESASKENRAAKFFCAMLAGASILDHYFCRGTKNVNVKMITSETKSCKN